MSRRGWECTICPITLMTGDLYSALALCIIPMNLYSQFLTKWALPGHKILYCGGCVESLPCHNIFHPEACALSSHSHLLLQVRK